MSTREELDAIRAANPFIMDPFQPLAVDPARYDPDEAYRIYLLVVNAVSHFLGHALQNKRELIRIASKKHPEYDAINAERYDIEYQIEALKGKKDALEQLFYTKSAEMRHLSKRSHLGQ